MLIRSTNNLLRAVLLSLFSFAFAILGFSGVAIAQQSAVDDADDAIEEIIVFARKRAETLQEIPMSIVAFQGEDIVLAGLNELEDLNVMVPNLSVHSSNIRATGETVQRVRGIPGVINYVDGIEVSGDYLLMREFVDIERVEILRGPQGTLFGRGAIGGLIQYVTKRPGDEFGGRASATAGSFDRQDIKLSVDLPLHETLRTRFTAAVLKRDGYITNILAPGVDNQNTDNTVLRADIVWAPTEKFSARFIWDSNDLDQNGDNRVLTGLFPTAGPNTLAIYERGFGYGPIAEATDFSTEAGLGEWTVAQSRILPNTNTQDLDQYTLDLSWDITDQLSIRSLTGYATSEITQYTDTDGTRYMGNDSIAYKDNETLTQEIQLLGSHERFDWVVGIFHRSFEEMFHRFQYTMGDLWQDPAAVAAATNPATGMVNFCFAGFPACFLPPGINVVNEVDDEINAYFGQFTWAATEQLDLTFGIRKNEDDNLRQNHAATHLIGLPGMEDIDVRFPEILSVAYTTAGTLIPGSDTRSKFDSTTLHGSVKYTFSDNVMAYASYSEGFGPGGAGTTVNPQLPNGFVDWVTNPQEVSMVEVGLRSDLFDKQLRLNVSVFDGDWDNISLSSVYVDPATGISYPVLVPQTVATGKVSGFEADITYVPADTGLMFNLNVGRTDAKYHDTVDPTKIAPDTQFMNTPEWSYSISAQHAAEFSNGGSLTSRLNYGWVDEYYTAIDIGAQTVQPAYGLLSLRATYMSPSEKWRLTLLGDNLTEEYYLMGGRTGAPLGTLLEFVGRPREWGMTLDFFF